MTFHFLLKTFLLVPLLFLLLTYTIYLFEKTNREQTQVKRIVDTGNLFFSLRILVVEYCLLLITLILWPFGFLNLKEGQDDNGQKRPVLFLHGLFLNRACGSAMKLRLRLKGWNDLHTINLPPTRDVETLTEKVGLKVDALRIAKKCDKVDLIGHSMGSVIARNYIQIRGGANKVEHCILLAGPHHGSQLAPFALTKLAEAIMPGSAFLDNLNSQPLPKDVRVTNIYSRHDNLVIPFESAILDKAHNVELTGKAHHMMLYDGEVFRNLLAALNEETNEDSPDQ